MTSRQNSAYGHNDILIAPTDRVAMRENKLQPMVILNRPIQKMNETLKLPIKFSIISSLWKGILTTFSCREHAKRLMQASASTPLCWRHGWIKYWLSALFWASSAKIWYYGVKYIDLGTQDARWYRQVTSMIDKWQFLRNIMGRLIRNMHLSNKTFSLGVRLFNI